MTNWQNDGPNLIRSRQWVRACAIKLDESKTNDIEPRLQQRRVAN
jgi:hypothetical protein